MNPIGYVAGALLAILVVKRVSGPSVQAAPVVANTLESVTVDGRSYSVLRMGGGMYTITRTNGATPPAALVISQTGPIGSGVGDATDLAALNTDMQQFPADMFKAAA